MFTPAEYAAVIAAALEEHEYVGLRTVEAGHDPLEESRVWADDVRGDDGIGGICATDVRDASAFAQHGLAAADWRVGQYFGEDTYIVAGSYAHHGADRGEIIIRDAVVLFGGRRA